MYFLGSFKETRLGCAIKNIVTPLNFLSWDYENKVSMTNLKRRQSYSQFILIQTGFSSALIFRGVSRSGLSGTGVISSRNSLFCQPEKSVRLDNSWCQLCLIPILWKLNARLISLNMASITCTHNTNPMHFYRLDLFA